MRRGLVLLLASFVLAGCHEQWGSTTWGGGAASSDEAAAEANVRASIPAIEAYYVDHGGTYEGATLATLRSTYDAGLPDVVIVTADLTTYCVESTVGEASFFKAGPGVEIFPGHCGDPVPEPPQPPPPVSYDHPEANIRAAIPAIEAWNADHGSYEGMTIAKLRAQYDYGIPTALKLSQISKTSYCLESTATNMTYSFRGPTGPVTPGPC